MAVLNDTPTEWNYSDVARVAIHIIHTYATVYCGSREGQLSLFPSSLTLVCRALTTTGSTVDGKRA